MTESAPAKMNEHATTQYNIDKEAAAKSRAESEEKLSKGKPTPTQDENDRAMMGEHIMEHEDDGSGPDPYPSAQATFNKQSESAGSSKGAYKTRESTASHTSHVTPTPTSKEK
jgi:hypothetical protein